MMAGGASCAPRRWSLPDRWLWLVLHWYSLVHGIFRRWGPRDAVSQVAFMVCLVPGTWELIRAYKSYNSLHFAVVVQSWNCINFEFPVYQCLSSVTGSTHQNPGLQWPQNSAPAYWNCWGLVLHLMEICIWNLAINEERRAAQIQITAENPTCEHIASSDGSPCLSLRSWASFRAKLWHQVAFHFYGHTPNWSQLLSHWS